MNSLLIVANTLLDPLAGMEHGGMVTAAERLADRLQGRAGQLADQVDGELSWPAQASGSARRLEFGHGHAISIGYCLLNVLDRRGLGLGPGVDLVEHRLGQADIDRE